jgi:hypothetical protein
MIQLVPIRWRILATVVAASGAQTNSMQCQFALRPVVERLAWRP